MEMKIISRVRVQQYFYHHNDNCMSLLSGHPYYFSVSTEGTP